MGNRLTEDQDSQQTVPKTYADIFDEFLPEYLAMGMPYDLYWDGEYGTKTAYRKAYQIRVENEQRLSDRNNWYIGQYIAKVLQAVPLLVNGFVPNGITPGEYPAKPFFEQHEAEKKEEDRRKKEEDQSKLAEALFQQFVSRINGNIVKRIEHEKLMQEGSGQ